VCRSRTSLARMKTVTLRTVLDQYLDRRTDVKEIPKFKWRQTCNALKEFFGADKPLASITVGEARDFERGLPQMRKSRYEMPIRKRHLPAIRCGSEFMLLS